MSESFFVHAVRIKTAKNGFIVELIGEKWNVTWQPGHVETHIASTIEEAIDIVRKSRWKSKQ